jgi:hypothetical protein
VTCYVSCCFVAVAVDALLVCAQLRMYFVTYATTLHGDYQLAEVAL